MQYDTTALLMVVLPALLTVAFMILSGLAVWKRPNGAQILMALWAFLFSMIALAMLYSMLRTRGWPTGLPYLLIGGAGVVVASQWGVCWLVNRQSSRRGAPRKE